MAVIKHNCRGKLLILTRGKSAYNGECALELLRAPRCVEHHADGAQAVTRELREEVLGGVRAPHRNARAASEAQRRERRRHAVNLHECTREYSVLDANN